jgi:hypothetical protein
VVLLDGQRRSPARKLAIECGPGAGIAAPLDATIQLFAPATNRELIPAIRPIQRGLFFRQGEQMRLCLSTLREAGWADVRSAGGRIRDAGGAASDRECTDPGIHRGAGSGGAGRLENRGLMDRI